MPADPFTYLEQNAPRCSCGKQYRLGGTERLGPLFVCTGCSHIAAPEPGWIDDRLAEFEEAQDAR